MKIIRTLAVAVGLMAAVATAEAQRIGVSTNALYWALGAPNANLQVRMSRDIYLSMDFVGRPHLYDLGGIHASAFAFSPEVRWYLLKQGMQGHFVGPTLQAAFYNGSWNERSRINNMGETYLARDTHRGDAIGLGMVYGYDWMLSDRWNIEAMIGFGGMYIRDTKNLLPAKQNHFVPAVLKLGVNFTYFIR